jgi:hypothetical protein
MILKFNLSLSLLVLSSEVLLLVGFRYPGIEWMHFLFRGTKFESAAIAALPANTTKESL